MRDDRSDGHGVQNQEAAVRGLLMAVEVSGGGATAARPAGEKESR